MKFEGAVKSSELPDIFQLLSSSSRQGALVVTQGKRRQKVYFGPEGITLPYDTEQTNRLLGQVLIGRGIITGMQLKAALEKQRASGLPLGEILCNAGAAQSADILSALTYQLREELFDILTWEHAMFEFIEGEFPSEGGRSYLRSPSFNTDAIIMEAARRADEWKRLRKAIPSEQAVLLKVPGRALPEDAESGESLSHLLEQADGTNSIGGMLKELGRSEFDVYESACQALSTGVARLASASELADLAAEALKASQSDRAKRLLANASALAGDNLEVRYDIGTLYLWAGDESEAAGHLDTVLGRLVDENLAEKMEQMLDHVRDEFPDAPYSYERRLKVLDPKKDFDKALPIAARLLELYKTRGDSKTAQRMLRWLKQFNIAHTDDGVRFGELLESHGDAKAAAHQYFLAAKHLRFAMKHHEAIRLCRKAVSMDPNHAAARTELNELMEAPRRRRRKIILAAGLAAALLTALVFASIQLSREHAAGRALEQADEIVRDLESRQDFEGALRAYEELLGRASHTMLVPVIRQRIEEVKCDAAAFFAGRRFTTETLLENAAAATESGNFKRAATHYEKFAELTAPGKAHDAALATAAFLHKLEPAKRR